MTVRQLEQGTATVENQYARIVRREGNRAALAIVNQVFEVCDRKWRGVGSIPKSGYLLRWEFREHDAERLFDVKEIDTQEPSSCISGLVLRGVSRTIAPPSEKSPHPSTRSARPWVRALAPLIMLTAAICALTSSQPESILSPPPPADRLSEPARDKILRKCAGSVEMKQKFFTQYAGQIDAMARDMATRFEAGKKLLVMGNGGSLCDALHFSVEFTHPIIEKRRAFPVVPLMTDIDVM